MKRIKVKEEIEGTEAAMKNKEDTASSPDQWYTRDKKEKAASTWEVYNGCWVFKGKLCLSEISNTKATFRKEAENAALQMVTEAI